MENNNTIINNSNNNSNNNTNLIYDSSQDTNIDTQHSLKIKKSYYDFKSIDVLGNNPLDPKLNDYLSDPDNFKVNIPEENIIDSVADYKIADDFIRPNLNRDKILANYGLTIDTETNNIHDEHYGILKQDNNRPPA